MPLHLDDLSALEAPVLNANGQPLMLSTASIDEDPEQPRHEFDSNALQELADTIRERGVRQPISVRPNVQQAGRWLLNFGARRLRATRIAGQTEIPAFVDTTADSYDQLIENEHREGLKPLELSLFVQKRLAMGDNQAEIAKRLGKSRQWVTLTTALIEAPDWLLQAYREGRCRGMNELYELRRLHGEHAEPVATWVAAQPAITRDRIAALRVELETRAASAAPVRDTAQPMGSRQKVAEASTRRDSSEPRATRRPNAISRNASSGIHVEFDGQDYQLVVSVAPEQPGHLFVRPLTGGPRRLVPVGSLKLLGFVGRRGRCDSD